MYLSWNLGEPAVEAATAHGNSGKRLVDVVDVAALQHCSWKVAGFSQLKLA